MIVREIEAKTILNTVRPQPDTWFGLRYNLNLYRGCQHQCIYCDSRSECYQIADFNQEVLVKVNAIDLLRRELPRKRVKGIVGLGSMNDPYMPLELQYNLTGRCLQVIAENGYPVHVITKSDNVLRDVDILAEIQRVHALVTFSITCAEDDFGKKVEPGAALVSARLKAMQILAEHGITTGVALMPVLPYLEDSEENILQIVNLAHQHGASYILPGFGMTLRDRQRAYYYQKLDSLFPGIKETYIRQFGEKYGAGARNAQRLADSFNARCSQLGIATRVPLFIPPSGRQLSLFGD